MKKILLISFSAITILSACKTAEAPEINADTLLDDDLFLQATRSDDLEKCKAIKEDAKTTECKQTVQADLSTRQAVEKNDPELCKSIELQRYKENCLNSVEQKISTENKEEQFIQSIKTQQKLSQRFIDTDDLKGCGSLETETFQQECQTNIYLKRAAAGDKSNCEKISNNTAKETCLGL